MYNFIYNNKSSLEFSAFVVNRPNIPTANENIKEYSVAGRNGTLTVREGTFPDITISIDMVYTSDADQFAETFRSLKAWLFAKEDNRLFFSDDAGFFYVVKNVTVSENERTKRYIGNFTVNFICEAHQYAVEGYEFMSMAAAKNNPYDLCHPIYKIVGEGVCTLNVNGKSFRVNVGQNAIIDTDKMITYREDGVLQNTIASGDYEDLYLMHGDNTITATSGFTVTVKPRWGKL